MKKILKKSHKISTTEFDAKFDAGEDITDHLDFSTARFYEPGEERLDLTIRKVNLDIPQWMIESLDREAARIGVPRQSVIKTWLADRLQEMPAANQRYGPRRKTK